MNAADKPQLPQTRLRSIDRLRGLNPPGFGVGLGAAYLLWAAIVIALYPACVWFAGVKARRSDWWLSYL